MKPRTCFFLSWHLSPCLSILLETPPSNCQLHLRLSSKCFSLGMVFTGILRLSRSCGGTLSPTSKLKSWPSFRPCVSVQKKRLWTFFCYQCAHIPASQLPRDLCPPSSGSGTAPRSRRCFRNWQLRLKFNPIFNRDTENQTVSFLFLLNEPSCSTRTTDINTVLS